MSDELLTAAQATEFLQLPSVRAFYAWARRRGIKSRVGGRLFRVYKRDLVSPQSSAGKGGVVVSIDAYARGAARA